MCAKRLAITKDGHMTYCTATDESIGRGRCNHIDHQGLNESMESFVKRVDGKRISIKCTKEEILSLKMGSLEDPIFTAMDNLDYVEKYIRDKLRLVDGLNDEQDDIEVYFENPNPSMDVDDGVKIVHVKYMGVEIAPSAFYGKLLDDGEFAIIKSENERYQDYIKSYAEEYGIDSKISFDRYAYEQEQKNLCKPLIFIER